MIDKIVSFGDSFIYGSDLPDCDGTGFDKFSKLTWPALCAKELGLDYYCYAEGARGNEFISSRVIEIDYYSHFVITPQKFSNALVIINWSWVDRFDFFADDGSYHSLMPESNTELSNLYYKNFHSQVNDLSRNLSLMHATHSYLKDQNILFVSSIMDRLIVDDNYNQDNLFGPYRNIQNLVKKDISWFPGNQTFLEWSRSNNYPESDGWHPLEQAHEAAAKYWLPIYKKEISKHIIDK